jgi:hypothetical protein
MGLFDNVFGGMSPSKQLSHPEAFAAVLLGAVACDGHIAAEECQGLWTIMERMKLYSNWSPNKYNQMMDRLIGILKREGLEGLIEKAASSLPDDLRETAFAGACDLVLADGVVEDAEKEFLDKLQKKLDISGDLALTIVEVMIIKNRG